MLEYFLREKNRIKKFVCGKSVILCVTVDFGQWLWGAIVRKRVWYFWRHCKRCCQVEENQF